MMQLTIAFAIAAALVEARSAVPKRSIECREQEQTITAPVLLQVSMPEAKVEALQDAILRPVLLQESSNHSQMTQQKEGACTGELVKDIDMAKVPEAIKDEIKKCIKENLLVDPSCRCAIYELSYWNWCKETLADGHGLGDNFVGDLVNQGLTAIIEAREDVLHSKIDDHGVGCKAAAYSSSSSTR